MATRKPKPADDLLAPLTAARALVDLPSHGIAAGGLIVECAGGSFRQKSLGKDYAYEILATNAHLARKLESVSRRG